MAEKTIFPREEKADVLFNKILNDPWACEKLQGTFCNSLFCNEDNSSGDNGKLLSSLQFPVLQ